MALSAELFLVVVAPQDASGLPDLSVPRPSWAIGARA